jgi:arginine repressor
MNDQNGQALSLGSGFFVRRGIIATNLHVVQGATGGYAKLIEQSSKRQVTGVVAIDWTHDLALVEVPDQTAIPLSLGDSTQLAVGDEIYAIGNPQGLEGTLSQGIISGIRTVGVDSVLQITAPISPGSSGGPVLNARGEVIGIAVATLRGGQNLNFAIPAKYLAALCADIQSARPLSILKSKPGQAKGIASNVGEPPVKGLIATQFLWDPTYIGDFSPPGGFSLSLRNTLPEPVSKVRLLIIFYDRSNRPLETYEGHWDAAIRPGLAARVDGLVDGSVRRLTGRVEFRILDFRLGP